ncbi:hypothetical protein [[Pseudomonas] boreopolis]|uniref:hypothetical protein n=1 Tax=Xanthomonas boreopolis TaxID=86183 RepID=UPI003D4D1D53
MSATTLTLLALNAVTFSSTTDYDDLGRVVAVRGNNGQNVRYAYDAEGRITEITDSQGRKTVRAYDARGRLVTSTDANGGVITFAYDADDNVAQVIDPRGLVTAYEYDGFGQLWKQISPDTGTTTYQYDAAGQRTGMTRNDGGTTVYQYDGLGRLVGALADDQSQSYSYDWCSRGIGRLCGISAPNNSTHFAYTPEGQLTIRRDFIIVGGQQSDDWTLYGYDSIGRLNSITYPDGVAVGYGYSGGYLSAMSVNMNGNLRPVINNVNFQPFGQRRSFNYGNGAYRGYEFDLDGRLTTMSVRQGNEVGTPLSYWDYRYTADNQISQIADAVNSNLTQDFGYDALGRLTKVVRYGVTNQLSYDRNGNHDRFIDGTNTTQYTIEPDSNRVLSYASTAYGARQYQYDALGNRLRAANKTALYT